MSTFEEAHATTAVEPRTATAMAGGFFTGMFATLRHRAEIMAAERRLRDMPDHMLKDIGLHRSEITAMVRMGRDGFGR